MVKPPSDEDASAERPRHKKAPAEWGDGWFYDRLAPSAYEVKAALQMVIGCAAIVLLAIHFVGDHHQHMRDATEQLLGGIGIGLAAAAVIELAYTLFTAGPDEALDPLMLGLASAILLLVGGLDNKTISFGRAAALLVLGILLAILFATRLMLAADEEPPDVWWVRRILGLRGRQRRR